MDNPVTISHGESTITVPERTTMEIEDELLGFVEVERSLTLLVKEGAHVRWQTRHRLDCEAEVKTKISVTLEKGASFEGTWIQTGGKKGGIHFVVILAGSGAQAALRSRITTMEDGKHACIISQQHEAAATKSFVETKTALFGRSSFSYDGTITIGQHGSASHAFQEQKNLVMSEGASVSSIPNLQVLTNDVQCGHGSAVSYVSKEKLFYMQARGLSEQDAVQLLVESFLAF